MRGGAHLEEILNKMNNEKRENLINAALTEFGINDYDKASTNVIVKNAGISKGLLYHYFKNKKELYEYLVRFVLEKTTKEILDNIDYDETDILNRIASTAEYKMKLFYKYPGMVQFYKKLTVGKGVEELKKQIDEYYPGYYEKYFSYNIEYSKFRKDIELTKMIKMTQWILEKYSEEIFSQIQEKEEFDMDKMYEELNDYLKLLKILFYN